MADYPISNVPRRVQYVNSGVGPYAFTFEVLVQTDIAVYRGSTLLTLTADYTVTINANGTGSVTLVTAGTGNITIVGARAVQRSSDYTTGGDLFASTLNTDLDSQTIFSQQLAEDVTRSVKAPVYDSAILDMSLPNQASRANKLFAFNNLGAPVVSANTLAAVDAAVSTINSIAGAPAGSSAGISHISAGTNAVATTVQTKLREILSAKDFGAVGDGTTDDTVALKNAFDYAIPLGIPVELEGNYLISGPIQPYLGVASGSLHIVCKGDVRITVNPSAAGFSDVLYLESTAINNASITGNSLSIDGSSKAGRGITIRHNGGQGGNVVISARLKITNILETDAAATRENQALSVYGRYETVVIDQPFIQNVNRTNAAAGSTKGISVSVLAGTCTINQPYVENVLCVSSAGVDADGIAVFGYLAGSTNNARQGTAVINEPTIINCQGRSFKGQISDVAIYRPRVKRTGAVVAIQQGNDFDFQLSGEVLLHEPVFEYYEEGGVSPFSVAGGSSFSSVVFQQTLDDREMSSRSIGGTIYTQVQWPRYCAVILSATAKRSVAEVSGLKIIPVGAFASSAINRAIMEVNMGLVAAKADKTKLIVRNVEGPFTSIVGIGYVSYVSGALDTKFSWQVTDCTSTLSGTPSRAFGTLSGTQIGEVEAFLVRDNHRFSDLLQASSQVFSFAKLVPGCKFSVDLATLVSVTNAPPWGTNGYAYIECLQQWAAGDSAIKVYVNEGDKASMRFFTRNNGVAWASEALFGVSAANIASVGAFINTRNKLFGLMVYDTTNNRVMVASGSLPASPWYVADGSASVTPT
jgi:hypothetical protein